MATYYDTPDDDPESGLDRLDPLTPKRKLRRVPWSVEGLKIVVLCLQRHPSHDTVKYCLGELGVAKEVVSVTLPFKGIPAHSTTYDTLKTHAKRDGLDLNVLGIFEPGVIRYKSHEG